MKCLVELSNKEAKDYFLKGSSYFSNNMPKYIKFDTILCNVNSLLDGKYYRDFGSRPSGLSDVNYNFATNKDGRFAWRPLELIHPAIYVSLVNLICEDSNWDIITKRFSEFEKCAIDCCSAIVIPDENDHQTSIGTQIKSWWEKVEQQSLIYSLSFSHVLHTDVIDCYGSIYTHAISWAIHGKEEAKNNRRNTSLLGNKIDEYIRDGRLGQTNGISQGSFLMDFIAEIVLGYVDQEITIELGDKKDFKILRYRDDYRIFTNSDDNAEGILKIISNELRLVGMKLNTSKTFVNKNVIEASIKPGKLAAIELQDLGEENAKTTQKQLLRIHSFGQRFPNSRTLNRLLDDFHEKLSDGLKQSRKPKDLEVLVAIATDIAFVSPITIPIIAAILSGFLSLASGEEKSDFWEKVLNKMRRIPNNGYLEIWLQRIIYKDIVKGSIKFDSEEKICKIVNKQCTNLWENKWISKKELKNVLDDVSQIIFDDDVKDIIDRDEMGTFSQKAWSYWSY